MLAEIRTYTLHPGVRDELWTWFESEALPAMEDAGMHVLDPVRLHSPPTTPTCSCTRGGGAMTTNASECANASTRATCGRAACATARWNWSVSTRCSWYGRRRMLDCRTCRPRTGDPPRSHDTVAPLAMAVPRRQVVTQQANQAFLKMRRDTPRCCRAWRSRSPTTTAATRQPGAHASKTSSPDPKLTVFEGVDQGGLVHRRSPADVDQPSRAERLQFSPTDRAGGLGVFGSATTMASDRSHTSSVRSGGRTSDAGPR